MQEFKSNNVWLKDLGSFNFISDFNNHLPLKEVGNYIDNDGSHFEFLPSSRAYIKGGLKSKISKVFLREGEKKDFLLCLSIVFASKINDVSIFMSEDGCYSLYIKENNEYIKYNSMGSGFKNAFNLFLACKSIYHGVVLIENFEMSLHPSIMQDVLYLCVKMANQNNNQIIATINSDEILKRLVNKDEVYNVPFPESIEKDFRYKRIEMKTNNIGVCSVKNYNFENLSVALEANLCVL